MCDIARHIQRGLPMGVAHARRGSRNNPFTFACEACGGFFQSTRCVAWLCSPRCRKRWSRAERAARKEQLNGFLTRDHVKAKLPKCAPGRAGATNELQTRVMEHQQDRTPTK